MIHPRGGSPANLVRSPAEDVIRHALVVNDVSSGKLSVDILKQVPMPIPPLLQLPHPDPWL